MVLYILMVGLLNMGAGFALAVCLGRRQSSPLLIPSPPRQDLLETLASMDDPMERPSAIQTDEKPPVADWAAKATWHDPGAAVQLLLDDAAEQLVGTGEYKSKQGSRFSGLSGAGESPAEQLPDRVGLDEGPASIAHRRRSSQTADEPDSVAPLTGICNRTGLEAELARWWSHDPDGMRPLGVALIDIDHFSRVSEQHGQGVGDQVLHGVVRLLAKEIRGSRVVARHNDQAFAVLFPDADIRSVTRAVEKLRQITETTRFQVRSQEFQVTLSCGVTESRGRETLETLFARLEAAVQEARRYGCNRTFFHDGKYPTPVVPLNLTPQERTIVL